MKYQKKYRSMMTVSRLWLSLFVTGVFSSFFGIVNAQQCKQERGITSNYIAQLYGYDNTLCMITVDPNQFALNILTETNALDSQRVTSESNWLAYYHNSSEIFTNVVSGGEWLAACTDSSNWTDSSYFTYVKFTDPCQKLQKKRFNWPEGFVSEENFFNVSTHESAYLNGSFYFACMDGGVARWNTKSDSITVFFPESSEIAIENVPLPSRPDISKRVRGVKTAGNSLFVTTQSKVWVLNTENFSWDSSIQSKLSDSNLEFQQFEAVFVKPGNTPVLYALIETKTANTESLNFFKYNNQNQSWRILLEEGNVPHAVSFGVKDYIYMLTEDNTIQVYHDTTGDTLINQKLRVLKDYSSAIQTRMMKKYDIDIPDNFDDILFVPKGNETGYLWVATSDGLFFSDNEIPEVSTNSFSLIKRSPKVKSGLKKSYARPGILTAGGYGEKDSRTVFIYNLSENAKVTIKVYDFNMDLVKTIIKDKSRKAGNDGGPFGRSTVEREDFWDGKNSSGRNVAPGVYYYKITTDTGERTFGKIVVAK